VPGGIGALPEISRFFGIVVRMFVEAAVPHHRPHFHAYYQGGVGVFALDDIEIIGGSLPARQARGFRLRRSLCDRQPRDLKGPRGAWLRF
jgi:hypothetical protein